MAFEVIKETANTYWIEGCIWQRVFKTDMSVGNYYFKEDYGEAVMSFIEFCKKSIEWHERHITHFKSEIEMLEEVIAKYEKNTDEH